MYNMILIKCRKRVRERSKQKSKAESQTWVKKKNLRNNGNNRN